MDADKQELLKKVGERIKSLRQAKGISGQELAALVNLEKSNLSRLEAGNYNTGIYGYYKIANALGITLSKLFQGID